MQVDRQKFMEDGFLILRNVVPPGQLDGLRMSIEELVTRQRAIWAEEAGPDDPPGGRWETGKAPRVSFDQVVDKTTADTVAFCLHENTLGVAQQLITAPEVGLHVMHLLCNPQHHHGPAKWHRDTGPTFDAPLEGLELDLLANGPGYLQWNIPLYDDDVLWVVPGSHRRPNTAEEQQQLDEDPTKPLPEGIPVELEAGDGVVYANFILHWGSNYSPKLRRTIHTGYQSFGGPLYRYFWLWWTPEIVEKLPPEIGAAFKRWQQCIQHEHAIIESIYRSIIERNAKTFRKAVAELHPGEVGRMVCVVLAFKTAQVINALYSRNGDSDELKAQRSFGDGPARWLYDDVAHRFTPDELETLWKRFSLLHSKLQTEEPQNVAGSQSSETNYRVYEMPPNFGIEEFIASWGV